MKVGSTLMQTINDRGIKERKAEKNVVGNPKEIGVDNEGDGDATKRTGKGSGIAREKTRQTLYMLPSLQSCRSVTF